MDRRHSFGLEENVHLVEEKKSVNVFIFHNRNSTQDGLPDRIVFLLVHTSMIKVLRLVGIIGSKIAEPTAVDS